MPQSSGTLLMFGLIFVVMYFMMIRPQQKREKALKAYRNSLKKGDEVITRGGIFGKVLDVKDDVVLLEIGSVKVKVELAAVSAANPTKKDKA